jgi:hypothetical protein
MKDRLAGALRADIAILLALLGMVLSLSAAIAGRSLALPETWTASQLAALPTPTATEAAESLAGAAWWERVILATPALPPLPGLPKVGLGGAAAQAGVPVPLSVVSCSTPGVAIRRVITAKPGWWNLEGDAAIANLEYWKGEISADGQGWTMLYRSATAVHDGLLIEFNTRTVPRGTYLVRLTAVNRTGNYPPPCTIRITTG